MFYFKIILISIFSLFSTLASATWVDGSAMPFVTPTDSTLDALRKQILASQVDLANKIGYTNLSDPPTLTLDAQGFSKIRTQTLNETSEPVVWTGEEYVENPALEFSFDEISPIADTERAQQVTEILESWVGRFDEYAGAGKIDSNLSFWAKAASNGIIKDISEVKLGRSVFTVSVVKNGRRVPIAIASADVNIGSKGEANLYISKVISNPESLLARDARVSEQTFGGGGNSIINRIVERFFGRGTSASQGFRSGELSSIPLNNRMRDILRDYNFKRQSC